MAWGRPRPVKFQMTQPENHSPEHALPSGRLNGWKDIAAFLGKSVRTVQRWEKELGLPVHRIHTSRGEIIHALPNEIESWLARTENLRKSFPEPDGREDGLTGEAPGHPAPSASKPDGHLAAQPTEVRAPLSWGWRQVAVAAVGALVVAVGLLALLPLDWGRLRARATLQRAQPTSFHVEGNRLRVFGPDNRQLWEHTFPFALAESFYDGSIPILMTSFAQFADLDGEGQIEVIFIAASKTTEEPELFVFNSDGSVRFTRRPGRAMRFGNKDYSPPFFARGVLIAAGADGKKSLWLVGEHNVWFPAVVEKLTPQGEVAGEYWSNGHINKLAETAWNGRKVILAGAMYNDQRRTSLAVLDSENPSGSAPAVNPTYRCDDCPPGQPLLFYVFPRLELSRAQDTPPNITTLRATPHGDVLVAVEHSGVSLPGESTPQHAPVFYTLNPQLEMKEAEAGDGYRRLHSRLELLGRLKHPYGAGDEAELFPVLRWDGRKFVPVSAPPAAAQPAGRPAAAGRK